MTTDDLDQRLNRLDEIALESWGGVRPTRATTAYVKLWLIATERILWRFAEERQRDMATVLAAARDANKRNDWGQADQTLFLLRVIRRQGHLWESLMSLPDWYV